VTKDVPITNHILDIIFPESYHLNIVELVRFASEANLLRDERTRSAVDFLLTLFIARNPSCRQHVAWHRGYLITPEALCFFFQISFV